MYAGATTSIPKVGEYGGNSFGYGGRSVVKPGWPKEPVKVCWKIVSFSHVVSGYG